MAKSTRPRPRRSDAVALACAEAVERRLLLSTVQLVADLDPRTQPSMNEDLNNQPQMVAGPGRLAVFTAAPTAGQLGFQPWRSDGTPEGTFQLSDVRIGEGGLSQDRMVAGPDGTVFFRGYTPQSGHELWKTDGTVAGTSLVRDIIPGPPSGIPITLPMATFAGPDGRSRVVFNAYEPQAGQRLWVSDGTEAGTQPFFDIPLTWVTDLTGSGSQAYFVGTDSTAGPELWRTDGTTAGTRRLTDIWPGPQPSSIRYLTPAPGGVVYFLATDDTSSTALWRSDGTEAGTYVVARSPKPYDTFTIQRFGVAGDTLYFFMDRGLWKTHGQPNDATLVREIPGGGGGTIAVAGSTAYLFGTSSAGLSVLWKSDGTAGGTVPVVPVDTLNFPVPTDLLPFNGRVYFRANRYGLGSNDVELWSTDGTAAGTVRAKDIAPGEGQSSSPFLLTPVGERLFFVANDGTTGFEPWVTDGTEQGTRLLRDISVSPQSSSPTRLTRAGDKVFLFTVDRPGGGLWVTDGTPGGTNLLRSEIFPADPFAPGRNLVADVNGTFFFVAAASGERASLWKSDGTPEGTARAGGNLYGVSRLTPAGDRLFFTAIDPADFQEKVWVVDRTGGGPRVVLDFSRAFLRQEVLWMTAVGDVVYFPAMSQDVGEELWRSDGTPAGTHPVLDLYPGRPSSQPRALTDLGGTLMFMAQDATGVGLFRSGGTAQTTTLVKHVDDRNADLFAWYNSVVSRGVMIFDASYDAVWRTDGTPEGTFAVKDSGGFGTPPSTAPGGVAVARDGRVYFTSYGPGDVGLWVTDGTRDGTRGLYTPQVTNAPPHHIAASPAGGVFFNASPVGNYFYSNLWESDGTPEGTHSVGWDDSINAGRPADLVPLGDGVLFAGSDPVVGRELFKVVPGPAPARVVGRRLFYNRSAFDGNNAGPGPADDAAIAADKVALLPGEGPGDFDNVSSYSRGINGIMIDVTGGLPLTALAGIAGALGVKVGTSADPGSWPDAPAPARIDIRPGAGAAGSDRITLIWNDNAIRNTWLRVTVPERPTLGLPKGDVFYFGHRAGEVNGSLIVNALDLTAVRRKLNMTVPISDPQDLNRDGRVNALDLTLVRQNLPSMLPPLFSGGGIGSMPAAHEPSDDLIQSAPQPLA